MSKEIENLGGMSGGELWWGLGRVAVEGGVVLRTARPPMQVCLEDRACETLFAQNSREITFGTKNQQNKTRQQYGNRQLMIFWVLLAEYCQISSPSEREPTKTTNQKKHENR